MGTHPLWRPLAPSANEQRQSRRIARRQTPPGPLTEHDPGWASCFLALRTVIEAAIPEQVRELRHVDSTAVPGLPAKPVIDVDLTVRDVTDELSYLPALGAVGFRLIFRDEMAGDPHRQLTYASPNANVHVWSPGAIEPQRHALFVRWLSRSEGDRDTYATAKRQAARDRAASQPYNDLKAAVVYDLYERAFANDPAHDHEPQPRR